MNGDTQRELKELPFPLHDLRDSASQWRCDIPLFDRREVMMDESEMTLQMVYGDSPRGSLKYATLLVGNFSGDAASVRWQLLLWLLSWIVSGGGWHLQCYTVHLGSLCKYSLHCSRQSRGATVSVSRAWADRLSGYAKCAGQMVRTPSLDCHDATVWPGLRRQYPHGDFQDYHVSLQVKSWVALCEYADER